MLNGLGTVGSIVFLVGIDADGRVPFPDKNGFRDSRTAKDEVLACLVASQALFI